MRLGHWRLSIVALAGIPDDDSGGTCGRTNTGYVAQRHPDLGRQSGSIGRMWKQFMG